MKEFIQELEASVPGIDPGTLTPETVFRDLPVWDSLAALTALAAVNACYGVQISGEELRRCRTIAEIEESALRKRSR